MAKFVLNIYFRDSSRFKDKPGAPPVHGLIESVSGAGPSMPNNQLVMFGYNMICC